MNTKTGGGLIPRIPILCILLLVASPLQSKSDPLPGSNGAAPRPAPAQTKKEALNRKLDAIKFPTVDFDNALFVEILDWIAQESRELDRKQYGGNGVSIASDIVEHDPDPGSGHRLSLHLRNQSMRDVVRYATDIAGCKFRVQPWGIVVVPCGRESPGPIVTRTYTIQPADLMHILKEGGVEGNSTNTVAALPGPHRIVPKPITRDTLKDYFMSCSGTVLLLPPQTMLAYEEALSTLIVTSGQRNIASFEERTPPLALLQSEVELNFTCLAFPSQEIDAAARKVGQLAPDQDIVWKAWNDGRGRLLSTYRMVTASGTETRVGIVQNPTPTDSSQTGASDPHHPPPVGTSFKVTAHVIPVSPVDFSISLALDATFSGSEWSSYANTPRPSALKPASPDSPTREWRITTNLACENHKPRLTGSFPTATGHETVFVFLTASLVNPAGR